MTSESSALDRVDVILHRPQSSENIGAVARAMKNFGLTRLVLVSPRRYEPQQAHKLAVHAEEILDNARYALTLEDGIAPYALVIPTTERAIPDRELPLSPREAVRSLLSTEGRTALMFGAEASGLTTALMARFPCYSSIPASSERRSLNLAQAVLLYAWELRQEALQPRSAPSTSPMEEPAPLGLVTLMRERARRILLGAGFLNPQQPDRVLDELLRLLQRGHPTRRELEMLLAAADQIERTSVAIRRGG